MLKSGGRLPRIELEEMGPSFDLEVRRSHLASEEVYKKACRQPRANKVGLVLLHILIYIDPCHYNHVED